MKTEKQPKRSKGRPKKPEGTAKTELVTLRLTPAEKKRLLEAAEKAGIPVSDYIKLFLRVLRS
jgi:hypothetical protein